MLLLVKGRLFDLHIASKTQNDLALYLRDVSMPVVNAYWETEILVESVEWAVQ